MIDILTSNLQTVNCQNLLKDDIDNSVNSTLRLIGQIKIRVDRPLENY